MSRLICGVRMVSQMQQKQCGLKWDVPVHSLIALFHYVLGGTA